MSSMILGEYPTILAPFTGKKWGGGGGGGGGIYCMYVCVCLHVKLSTVSQINYFYSGAIDGAGGNVLATNFMHSSPFGDGIFFDFHTFNDTMSNNIALGLFRCFKVSLCQFSAVQFSAVQCQLYCALGCAMLTLKLSLPHLLDLWI